jgi:hypothetical protein
MLVENSSKTHPEFDLTAAAKLFADAESAGKLKGELITSPHDLFSVEHLRSRHELRIGRAIPTDVFVFGKGGPPRPDLTQVGGTPYWPRDREWPETEQSVPYLFLAQVNFTDSKDLFNDLPADVLLIFVKDRESFLYQANQFHFVWLPSGLQSISKADFAESLKAIDSGPFYGAIYRSADYPDALRRIDGISVRESYNLPILTGTKIGGKPHFIQGGSGAKGEFLCQIGSIQAAPERPFPWVNSSAPLELGFSEKGIHGEENQAVFDDMGSIYIFRNRSGRLHATIEGY